MTSSTDEQTAVAAVPQKIVNAWADHDAGAFAETFTDDGTMILPGVYQKGKDAIRSFMDMAFNGPYRGTQVTGTPLDIRFLNAETVAMITEGGVLQAGESEVPGERAIRASWIAVKQDGEWRLAAYHNCPRD